MHGHMNVKVGIDVADSDSHQQSCTLAVYRIQSTSDQETPCRNEQASRASGNQSKLFVASTDDAAAVHENRSVILLCLRITLLLKNLLQLLCLF